MTFCAWLAQHEGFELGEGIAEPSETECVDIFAAVMGSLEGFEKESGRIPRWVESRYIFIPSGTHVTVPGRQFPHGQAVQDFGTYCRWSQGRCTWRA